MNQYLKDNTYKIPSNVLKGIQTSLISYPNNNGTKRAKNILRAGKITYQAMKRLKNFFDTFHQGGGNAQQYELAGGDMMKNFVDSALEADRDAVEVSKERRQDMEADVDMGISTGYDAPQLNETKEEYDIDDYDNLVKNALAVIVNSDNKILLLKRSDYPDQWEPKKWSLVGGGVEDGEKPDEACAREIKEEIGIDINIDDFVEKVVIQRNPGSVEHIFACRYEGELTDVELNEEHTNYGWFDVDEMEFLDIVPNLIDYINLVFKKYE